MTTAELILRQIVFLRQCMHESGSKGAALATAQNAYDIKDAEAGSRLISGDPVFGDSGEELKLTNDIARKAYAKDHALIELNALNTAKQDNRTAEKRVDVEISVLSALKLIAANEILDDAMLAKYDLLGDEAGI